MIIKILIALILVLSLFGCSESEEAKKERDRINSVYPLLGWRVPDSVINFAVEFKGFCKERNNIHAFEFNDGLEWNWFRFLNEKKIIQDKSFVPTITYLGPELPKDRYRKSLPPNNCHATESFAEISVNQNLKFEASCERRIYDDVDDGVVSKLEAAFCEIEVTKIHNCIPIEEDNSSYSYIQKYFKYDLCSSGLTEEYRKQVLARWNELIEKQKLKTE